MNHASHWPKKMSARDYAKRWYVELNPKTIVNSIKKGDLPGEQDKGGQWYVWVNSDFSPAFDYCQDQGYDQPENNASSSAANDAVQRVLEKHAAEAS